MNLFLNEVTFIFLNNTKVQLKEENSFINGINNK